MADNVAELTYELLKRVQSDLADMRAENRENRHRIMIGELHNTGVMAQLQSINERLDRLQSDMAVVKRRLDLVDTH